MIDQQEFNNLFHYFDKKMIIEIIDLFVDQQPEIVGLLEQSFVDNDLVLMRFWAHKFRSPCEQFFDPVSSKHAKLMEEAADRKIIEVVDSLIHDYPDSLRKMRKELDERDLIQEINHAKTLKTFLACFFATFSTEDAMKLKELEKRIIADGMPEMFADLKISTEELLKELLVMKKKLIS